VIHIQHERVVTSSEENNKEDEISNPPDLTEEVKEEKRRKKEKKHKKHKKSHKNKDKEEDIPHQEAFGEKKHSKHKKKDKHYSLLVTIASILITRLYSIFNV
jgi:hypothetical protein